MQCQLLFDGYIKDFDDNVNLKSLSLKLFTKSFVKSVTPLLIVSKYPVKDLSPVWVAVNDIF